MAAMMPTIAIVTISSIKVNPFARFMADPPLDPPHPTIGHPGGWNCDRVHMAGRARRLAAPAGRRAVAVRAGT
jgi:hypothetical protein